MFFILSKISTFIIDPAFLLVLFTFLSWLVSKKRYRQKLKSFIIILLFYLFSTATTSNALFSLLENWEKPSPLADGYDSVIVLSGMTRSMINPTIKTVEFTDAVDRLLVGISRVKEGKAETIIISGGDGSLSQENPSEAVLLKSFAVKWGLEERRIIIDATSKNTYENALHSAEIIKRQGFKKNLLITSAFHMVRARGCFRAAGVSVDVLPVDYRVADVAGDFRDFIPSAPALEQSGLFIHELVGILVYGITNKASYFD